MELDKIFSAFVNPQTIVICLAIYLMTFVFRKLVEGFWKGAKSNRLWREVWLPIGPVANGALIGVLAKTFVWPDFVGTSLSGRIMYGAICGVFSALIYSRVRSFVQSAPPKKGKDAGSGSVAAPSLPPMTSDPPAAAEEVPVETPAEEKKPEG